MRPAVGRSRPPRRLRSVDLPEPDLPSRATFSPRRTSSETPRRAQTRTDFPDVHSLVTSVSRTAGEVATRGVVTGEKRDISGASWGTNICTLGAGGEVLPLSVTTKGPPSMSGGNSAPSIADLTLRVRSAMAESYAV